MTSRGKFIGTASNAGPYRPGIHTHNNHTEERETLVSTALWCDKGEHAFSAKDPDKRHFTQTQNVQVPVGNSYGNPLYQEQREVTEELDICGPCIRNEDPFKAKAISPTEQLEAQDAQYRAGFEAGENHVKAQLDQGFTPPLPNTIVGDNAQQ